MQTMPRAGVVASEMIARVQRDRDLFSALLRDRILIRGVHYEYFGKKPTLLKAGAITVYKALGLTPRFEELPIGTRVDYDRKRFAFRYRCQLLDSEGKVVAEGIGSANSLEDKYHYEWVPAKEVPSTDGLLEKNGMVRIPHRDPARQCNVVDKLAQKNALVAAVLLATGADFTQDWGEHNLSEMVTMDESMMRSFGDLCAQYLGMSLEDFFKIADLDSDLFEMLTPESGRKIVMERAVQHDMPIKALQVTRKMGQDGQFWDFDCGFGHVLTNDINLIPEPIRNESLDTFISVDLKVMARLAERKDVEFFEAVKVGK